MKFTVAQRLLCLALQEIPRFGSIVTMGVVSDFFALLNFTAEEIENGEVKADVDEKTGMSNYKWNPSKIGDKDIEITPAMAKILVGAMERVPDQPGLSIVLVPIYREMKAMIPEEPKKEPKK